ncbi:hypothetical protein LSAT2_014408 [Lamellibrachia satsuma]|nr:hypothetical protein LSAT2_014408 [Lamellibrachia satsuma]
MEATKKEGVVSRIAHQLSNTAGEDLQCAGSCSEEADVSEDILHSGGILDQGQNNSTDVMSGSSDVTKCLATIKCEPDYDPGMTETSHEDQHVDNLDYPPCDTTQVIVKSEDGKSEEYNCMRRWVVGEDGQMKEVFEVKRADSSSDPCAAEHDLDIKHLQCHLTEEGTDSYWNGAQPSASDLEQFHASTDKGRMSGKIPGKGGRKKKKLEKSHTSHSRHICSECGKSFASSFNLVVHMRTHAGIKPFTCDTCGKSFSQFINLKGHENTHTGLKPYSCRICARSFAHYSTLRTHEHSHTGLKLHSCEKCGKAFGTKNTLKTHERTNTCVKPYSCGTCSRTFRDPVALERHEMHHARAKLYPCNTCGRSFAQSSTLKAHERTHSGVKPYPLLPLVRTKRLDLLHRRRLAGSRAGNVRSQKDEITKFFDSVGMEQFRKFVEKLLDKGGS